MFNTNIIKCREFIDRLTMEFRNIVDPDSLILKVEFLDVDDQINYNLDLICKYSLIDYRPVKGDRIALYKCGWSFIDDYCLFEWAPVNEQYVIFKNGNLPRNSQIFYQLCYLSFENKILGASKLFQLVNKQSNNLIASNNFPPPTSLVNGISEATTEKPEGSGNEATNNYVCKKCTQCNSNNYLLKRIEQLELENYKLKLAVKQTFVEKNYDEQFLELKNSVKYLTDVVTQQGNEIDMLKNGQQKKENFDSCVEVKPLNETVDSHKINVGVNLDLWELESIPPFPYST
ncbi:PREDICTED: tax1-binding protein 1 homolog [Nicrophorus vespilloides]|uniref:Tax1-binding protein 1 homolog n=1 Tax=Nicrophorus vespilloides TaxID=110193 RepID=A0ABM1N764_NICVS|nr:PREDICTED: tax1-binding protein 1 homolog [Nicrophorus vespilloides]XP_017782665.1 PREDICTED: tax1-binding protein 1 homolog [Nicrophorus vespilloides]